MGEIKSDGWKKIVFECEDWPDVDLENICLCPNRAESFWIAVNISLTVPKKKLAQMLEPLLGFAQNVREARGVEEIMDADYRRTWRITIEQV